MVICANPVTPELRREPLVVHKATLTSVLAKNSPLVPSARV